MLTLVDRIRGADEVGVPRRLSVGALFVLLTFYSVLFRLLVAVRADASWTGIICLFFAAVTVGQMVLFRGVRPRAASIVTGALTCPALLMAVVIDESLTQFTGWAPLAGGLGDPVAFVSAILTLSMVGMFLGYLFGGTIAGVFYVIAKFRPQSVIARNDVDSVIVARGDRRVTALVEAVGGWINPLQPNAPFRGAFAAFLLPVTLGCFVSPFVRWAWPSQVILFAAGLGILLAFWTGNFQLRFLWPFALCSIGAVLAAWPAASVLEIARFRDVFGERPDILRFVFRTLGGISGLTIAAVAGWTQWFAYRRKGKRRLGVAAFFVSAAVLVSIGWLITHRLETWAQSPREQLFSKIQADGGTLAWNSLTGEIFRWVLLAEKSGDDDFLRLRPLLVNTSGVELRGRGFTDETASVLEGLHLSSLRLIDTSITDGGFDGLHDMSATSVTLNLTNVGDHGLAQLTAMPAMRAALQSLALNRTKITDEGMAHLAPCGALTRLSLAECAISDAGLKTLAAAGAPVQQLILVGTGISDEGLAHLAQLKSLTELRVDDTAVTRAGIDALKTSLPRCIVIWDDPDLERSRRDEW